MLPPRLLIARIRFKRPVRPPNTNCKVLVARLFTQNSQLLLVSRTNARPELPYLYVSSGIRHAQPSSSALNRYQLSRWMTTERKQHLKSEAKRTIKYILLLNSAIVLIGLLGYLISIEMAERKYPTPPEWTFRSRHDFRSARLLEDPEVSTSGIVDSAKVGTLYSILLSRLEDPSVEDGKGLSVQLTDADRVHVVGLGGLGFGRVGLDVSSKSEEWRRGYHAALMGAAKAAENLDGCVRDKTRNIAFPQEIVIGPSNLRPKPVPDGSSPPLEENCVPAFEPPETFYTKILTSYGFSSRQRLDAALAYADWLDFKGLSSTAEDMYDWGLDIAMSSLPMGANNIADTKTGVISSDATYVSNNLLEAATALATHHARNNNLAMALPIFLSVLRARKQLSLPPVYDPPATKQASRFEKTMATMKSIVVSPPYPPPSPTGDEVPIRTPKAVCEEAAIMAHVGEIIFASSSSDSKPLQSLFKHSSTSQKQQSGLGWTRDSVDISETTLASLSRDDLDTRVTCAECLKTGMDNWSTMVNKMVRDDQRAKSTNQGKPGSGWKWNWFWNTKKADDEEAEGGRWERELRLVEERTSTVNRLLDREEEDRKLKLRGGPFGMIFS